MLFSLSFSYEDISMSLVNESDSEVSELLSSESLQIYMYINGCFKSYNSGHMTFSESDILAINNIKHT